MSAPPRQLEFDARAWNDMPPAERVRCCLMFANEATKQAANASGDVREAYSDLAKQWLSLAAEIEETGPAAAFSA